MGNNTWSYRLFQLQPKHDLLIYLCIYNRPYLLMQVCIFVGLLDTNTIIKALFSGICAFNIMKMMPEINFSQDENRIKLQILFIHPLFVSG